MAFDLFKPKSPPLFGLDISSSSVKMLEIVDAGKGAYRVERYSIEPLARDAVVDGNINNLEAVAEAVVERLTPIRTRFKAMDDDEVARIMQKGALDARARAEGTMVAVRRSVGLAG